MADPMHQFQIQKVVELPTVEIAGMAIDLSITNSILAMIIAAVAVVTFFGATAMGAKTVPSRLQVVGEALFGTIDDLSTSIIGHEGHKFFPFVFSLFLLILGMNLVGMTTYFTATSQLAVTVTLGLMTLLVVLVVGLMRNGLGFFKLFAPSGVPGPVLLLVIPIEIISFLLRPATLALRLFGNMVGGHIVLKIFAGFVVSLGTLGVLGWAGAALALTSVVALTALEFMVAALQAFVFAVMACVYLNDVVNLDSH